MQLTSLTQSEDSAPHCCLGNEGRLIWHHQRRAEPCFTADLAGRWRIVETKEAWWLILGENHCLHCQCLFVLASWRHDFLLCYPFLLLQTTHVTHGGFPYCFKMNNFCKIPMVFKMFFVITHVSTPTNGIFTFKCTFAWFSTEMIWIIKLLNER